MTKSYEFTHIGQSVTVYQCEDGTWGYCAEPSGCGVGGFEDVTEACKASIEEVEQAIVEGYGSIAEYYLDSIEKQRETEEWNKLHKAFEKDLEAGMDWETELYWAECHGMMKF
jgi:hypothetical protein